MVAFGVPFAIEVVVLGSLMNPLRHMLRLLLAIGLWGAMPSTVAAQAPDAVYQAVIVDERGAKLVRVTVVLRSSSSGSVR